MLTGQTDESSLVSWAEFVANFGDGSNAQAATNFKLIFVLKIRKFCMGLQVAASKSISFAK
jgi:hypothetical protein